MNDEPKEIGQYRGPELVYGMWFDAGFVVVGAEWAARAAEEIEATTQAETWAQAQAASNAATHIWGPLEDLEVHGLAPDEPVVHDQIPGWCEGDWPGMVCSYAQLFLPGDWPIGEVYSTMLNGEGIIIPTEDEVHLLEIAQQAGAPLTRNDALIARLDPQWGLA